MMKNARRQPSAGRCHTPSCTWHNMETYLKRTRLSWLFGCVIVQSEQLLMHAPLFVTKLKLGRRTYGDPNSAENCRKVSCFCGISLLSSAAIKAISDRCSKSEKKRQSTPSTAPKRTEPVVTEGKLTSELSVGIHSGTVTVGVIRYRGISCSVASLAVCFHSIDS